MNFILLEFKYKIGYHKTVVLKIKVFVGAVIKSIS